MTTATVNAAGLKTRTNELLQQVAKHRVVLITKRGRPCAALVPVSSETLVDLLWEYSSNVQRRLKIAKQELRSGRAESLSAFAKRHGLVA